MKRQQYIRNATAEMEQLETAIERYKAAYGFYPPDNQLNPGNPLTPNPLMNQLYFELLGTTNMAPSPASPSYQSLDDPSLPPLSQGNVTAVFGVSGFMNCSKPGSAEDAREAQDFLPGLKANQVTIFTNSSAPNNPVKLIITSVGGPDTTYHPLGPGALGINPWRYNSSNPTNNPGGVRSVDPAFHQRQDEPHLQLEPAGAVEQPAALNCLCAPLPNPDSAAANASWPLSGRIAAGARSLTCNFHAPTRRKKHGARASARFKLAATGCCNVWPAFVSCTEAA